MISISLIRSISLIGLTVICLAAGPAAPVPLRNALEIERLPHFDTTGTLPTPKQFELLASTDAIATLKMSITRAQREVRGYRAIFLKQERIGGTFHPMEEIAVAFREEPFAVLMQWKSGARKAVEATLYSSGDTDGKLLVRLQKFGLRTTVSIRGSDSAARGSARYGIEDFGIVLGSQRTLKSWLAARGKGELDVEYLGLQTMPELDGKQCYAIRRTCLAEQIDPFLLGDPPVPITDKNRNDAFKTVTIYFDPDTWLQVGSEQLRADGERIGAYFFRDVQLNPSFAKDEFKPAAFKK